MSIIASVIAAVITIVTIAVNSVYVFIGGEAIRKDSADVHIFLNKKIGRDLKKLDRFSEMKQLRLEYISDDVKTEYIPKIKRIESLGSACSEIKNTGFLNNFENIDCLHLF